MRGEGKIPFFLTARYLLHGNKWTLGLIIFLMAVAFVNLIFVASLFNGIIDNSNKQIINTYTGHVFITPAEGQDFLDHTDILLPQIENIPGVKAASAQMLVSASLKYKNIKGNWQILAIDPQLEKQVTNVSEKMLAGEYLAQDDLDKIIVGRQIAGGPDVEMNAFSFKGAQVGEKVVLAFDGIQKEFTIKGIFYTKFLDTDQRAFITAQALEALAPSLKSKATSVVIRAQKTGEEAGIVQALKVQNIAGQYLTWEDAAGLMSSVTTSFLSINFIMSFVAVLIAAVTIFIVIYIDISSKRQQIGILRAIGIRPYLIRATYVLQTLIYSVSGVALGLAIFFGGVAPYFKAHPFELPIGDSVLMVEALDINIRILAIIVVAVLSGLIPAFMITRIKILDAIWGK
ncbi:ABC transporter permease [Candidatus Parcubacteria bacterium]|jgi:putative ABC transport system permease protein|nr:MAG: ABC transporter permease [Candidatus Parcubacteria bacterium]